MTLSHVCAREDKGNNIRGKVSARVVLFLLDTLVRKQILMAQSLVESPIFININF